MAKKKSKKTMCLEYLKEHKTITPLEALDAFGSMRLAALIHELRDEGYNITTTINDKGAPYATYRLSEGE